MMVYLRESQILKGQVTKARHGIIARKFPAAHFLKKLSDRLRVEGSFRHSGTQHSARTVIFRRPSGEWKAITDTPTWSKANARSTDSKRNGVGQKQYPAF
jgi:hypothetical protein